jgi:hypothetical protein
MSPSDCPLFEYEASPTDQNAVKSTTLSVDMPYYRRLGLPRACQPILFHYREYGATLDIVEQDVIQSRRLQNLRRNPSDVDIDGLVVPTKHLQQTTVRGAAPERPSLFFPFDEETAKSFSLNDTPGRTI